MTLATLGENKSWGKKNTSWEKSAPHNYLTNILPFCWKSKSSTGKFERKCHFNFLPYGKHVKIPIKYENFQRFFVIYTQIVLKIPHIYTYRDCVTSMRLKILLLKQNLHITFQNAHFEKIVFCPFRFNRCLFVHSGIERSLFITWLQMHDW